MTVAKRIEKHIGGREATYVAIENDKRRPIALEPTADRHDVTDFRGYRSCHT